MKFRLILVVLLFLPMLANAQNKSSWGDKNTGPAGSEVILYSKGKMYVKYKDKHLNGTAAEQAAKGDSESTTLYIDGSAKFGDGATIEQKGRTELTGHFINGKHVTNNEEIADPSDPNYKEAAQHLFIYKDGSGKTYLPTDPNAKPADQKEGVIAFVGASGEKQVIFGYPVGLNNSAPNYAGLYNGDYKSDWDTQKKNKYIKFPTISVENGDEGNQDPRSKGFLEVDWSAAVEAAFLHVPGKNRFSVLAAHDASGAYLHTGQTIIKDITNSASKSIGGKTTDERTYSQVRLGLYNFQGAVDDGALSYNSVTNKHTITAKSNTLRGDANGEWNRLTGFSPPFKELGADYMFYHVLTEPGLTEDGKLSVAKNRKPMIDPFARLKAGRGYFLSMEVSHADHAGTDFDKHIDEYWDFEGDNPSSGTTGIHNSRRARGGYLFNRRVFHDVFSNAKSTTAGAEKGLMDNFSRFLYDNKNNDFYFDNVANIWRAYPANKAVSAQPEYQSEPLKLSRPIGGLNANGITDKYIEQYEGTYDLHDRSRYELMTDEKFNIDDVEVKLNPGFNFLGNPFMSPISLNPLLGLNVDGTSKSFTDAQLNTGFNVDEMGGIKASVVNQLADGIRAKYWLVNNAWVKRNDTNSNVDFKISYDYVSRDGATVGVPMVFGNVGGGTSNVIDPKSHLIAPMQMFILQAGNDGATIKLKKDLQTYAFGGTKFPKSVAASDPLLYNWFVVEAQDHSTNTADRTSIVFREDANLENSDPHDTKKGMIERDSDGEITDLKGISTKANSIPSEAVIYTKSSDGVAMLGNGVPYRTKELPLYFSAPEDRREVTLKFYNVENVEAVENIWLVDTKDNKSMRVSSDFEYTFLSNPSDSKSTDGSELNRFFLRFYDTEDDDIIREEKEISCYYSSSTLHVLGLNQGDINSDLLIYDMQGRMMGRTRVSNIDNDGAMEYFKPLGLGTYVVKIAGKRNYTSKFVNLQN